jgi:hypothetical protein
MYIWLHHASRRDGPAALGRPPRDGAHVVPRADRDATPLSRADDVAGSLARAVVLPFHRPPSDRRPVAPPQADAPPNARADLSANVRADRSTDLRADLRANLSTDADAELLLADHGANPQADTRADGFAVSHAGSDEFADLRADLFADVRADVRSDAIPTPDALADL